MKKIFILKAENIENGGVENLSTFAFKDYKTAVETLKEKLIARRYELMNEKYNSNTDMTEILRGFIEVYETKKGQYHEIFDQEPIKTYNYKF